MIETNTSAERLRSKTALRLVASPFLAQYLLVQPGRAAGVRIPEVRYEELRATGAEGRSVPDWLADAAKEAWGTELPASPVGDVVLVRERSRYRYRYGKASWEINLGCDYDCEFCYLGKKRFGGLNWDGNQEIASPQVKAEYDRHRDLGDRHTAAMRNVFNRLLGCLHHCLQTGQKFDPDKAFPAASTAPVTLAA